MEEIKETTQDILTKTEEIVKNAQNLLRELEAIKRGEDFLINEYKTNKRYFRMEPGKVTTEDIIKTAFEFGWSSRRQFQYDQEIEESRKN